MAVAQAAKSMSSLAQAQALFTAVFTNFSAMTCSTRIRFSTTGAAFRGHHSGTTTLVEPSVAQYLFPTSTTPKRKRHFSFSRKKCGGVLPILLFFDRKSVV